MTSTGPLNAQVESALSVLVGRSLWSSGRAADLEWFQFGQRRRVKNYRGESKEVGEYALHVQCPWRIRQTNRVVVGSHDLCYPANASGARPEGFDWQPQGSNKRDERIGELFQGETRQFMVREITVGQAGSFAVLLDEGYALEVFPTDSSVDEHWRIFKPYTEGPHFVVTGGVLNAADSSSPSVSSE